MKTQAYYPNKLKTLKYKFKFIQKMDISVAIRNKNPNTQQPVILPSKSSKENNAGF